MTKIKVKNEWELECVRWMGRILTGKYCHYCPDWDFLPIDDTCDEFQACTCPKVPEEEDNG